MTLIEAANERDEALAIATALRGAIVEPKATAALVTSDRDLARRVSAELLRFGIRADDSGGTPLTRTPPGEFLALLLEAVFRPGNPVPIAALAEASVHRARHRAQQGSARCRNDRAGGLARRHRQAGCGDARANCSRTATRLSPRQAASRNGSAGSARQTSTKRARCWPVSPTPSRRSPLAAAASAIPIAEIARLTIVALEALARDEAGGTNGLYERDAGEKFAGFFRSLIAATADFPVAGDEWPDIATALIATEIVKPAAGGDGRVAIWGALEARLQSVGTLVVGGLNEGSWPRRAESDRFMSRMMKGGLDLEPPERLIGLAAHDFMMAMGHERIVLTRSARSGDAPATASRWLQRLLTFAGPEQAAEDAGARRRHASRGRAASTPARRKSSRRGRTRRRRSMRGRRNSR